MFKPLVTAFAAIFTLLIFNTAWASDEVYTWTDENGRVHYSERAPKDVDAKKLNIKSNNLGSRLGGDPSSEGKKDLKAKFKEGIETRNAKKEEQRLAEVEKKVRKDRCTEARNILKAVSGNPRTRFQMKDGDVRAFTPEEIQEKRKAAQERIKEFCS